MLKGGKSLTIMVTAVFLREALYGLLFYQINHLSEYRLSEKNATFAHKLNLVGLFFNFTKKSSITIIEDFFIGQQ